MFSWIIISWMNKSSIHIFYKLLTLIFFSLSKTKVYKKIHKFVNKFNLKHFMLTCPLLLFQFTPSDALTASIFDSMAHAIPWSYKTSVPWASVIALSYTSTQLPCSLLTAWEPHNVDSSAQCPWRACAYAGKCRCRAYTIELTGPTVYAWLFTSSAPILFHFLFHSPWQIFHIFIFLLKSPMPLSLFSLSMKIPSNEARTYCTALITNAHQPVSLSLLSCCCEYTVLSSRQAYPSTSTLDATSLI